MKKKDYKYLIITCVVCLLPIVIGIIFYNRLPDRIAIHFDINNNPDDYFSKISYVFGLPIFLTIIQLFTFYKVQSFDNKNVPTLYIWVVPITSVIMNSLTTMYALGNYIDIRRIVMILIGVLLILIGNYTPKAINDKFIKVPKRLLYFFKKKYYKIYGYLLVTNGILFIISILFKPIVSVLLLISMIAEILFLYLYALIIRK